MRRRMKSFPNTFYFHLTIRFLAALCCIIILFCIGLSQYWTNRVSAIFGLLFVIISLLFIASSISIIFIWDIKTTSIVKQCLFTFIFTLSILIAAIMFIIANDGCDPKLITSNGCYQNISTGTFQVAIAFSFIIMAFGIMDLLLNCFFYWRESRVKSHIYDLPPTPPTKISVLENDKSIYDLYLEYQRRGQQTSV